MPNTAADQANLTRAQEARKLAALASAEMHSERINGPRTDRERERDSVAERYAKAVACELNMIPMQPPQSRNCEETRGESGEQLRRTELLCDKGICVQIQEEKTQDRFSATAISFDGAEIFKKSELCIQHHLLGEILPSRPIRAKLI